LSLGNVRGRTRLILDNGGDTTGRSVLLDTLAASGGLFGRLSGMGSPAAIFWTIGNAAGRNEIDSALIRMGAGANTFTLGQTLPVGSGSPLAYTIAATGEGDRVVVRKLSANATYNLQLINGTLVGPDAGMVWNLNGPDGGRMRGLALVFSGVRNLVGGAGRDVFLFNSPRASVSGNINGGTGVNWLDYSPLASSVQARLDTGVVSRVGGKVTRIDNLIGSASGGDTVYGTDRGGVLVTHLKNNLIQAGSGRTILIGGNGLNTLIGNMGDDLILDGRTSYDADYTSLERVRAVWLDAALTFETRVAMLQDPARKAFLKTGSTLFLAPIGPVGASPRVLIGAGARTLYLTSDARRIASFHAGTDRLVS
jgi:Ca2+-binding RTX toxin-like protein